MPGPEPARNQGIIPAAEQLIREGRQRTEGDAIASAGGDHVSARWCRLAVCRCWRPWRCFPLQSQSFASINQAGALLVPVDR